MSVLGHERWLLREAYKRADEALEFLSAELAKDEQHWIADTSSFYTNSSGVEQEDINNIVNHLASKPVGIFENPNVTRSLAPMLYTLHRAGDALSTLNHLAEAAIQEVRFVSIQASPESIRPRDDRLQSGGRHLSVREAVHAEPDSEHGGRSDSPRAHPRGHPTRDGNTGE